LTEYRRVVVLVAVALALLSAPAACALEARGPGGPAGAPTKLELGKQLYRKYCGQCHALSTALAAGFGTENGLGTDGGPSFDNLRVPFSLSVLAVTEPFIGHEVLYHKMTLAQIRLVSTYVATATKHNSVVARPTDG
jgi:mono/diheme cytochrome c family protein